jgi:hypothetical protein
VDFAKLTLPCRQGRQHLPHRSAVENVKRFYGGVKNSKGELIFSARRLGIPSERARHESVTRRNVSTSSALRFNDPNLDWQKFDLDRDMPLIDKAVGYVDVRESGSK